MNEAAMNYEYLIRSAYGCGRYGAPGANKDIFQSMEVSYVDMIKSKNNKLDDLNDLTFKYGAKAGEIATYITLAIDKVIIEHKNKLSQSQEDALSNCKSKLYYPHIEGIEDVIVECEKIMSEIGLYP